MVEDHNRNDELSLNIEETEKKSGPGFVSKLKDRLSLKMMIIIGSLLSLVTGLIILALVFLGGKGDAQEVSTEGGTAREEFTDGAPVILFDDIVKLDVIEIKLGDMGGEKRFNVGVSFKIDQQELRDELIEKGSQVTEIITVILKSKTYIELQGIDGKIILRNEIIKHLNEILETGRIVNLFFYDYLIL